MEQALGHLGGAQAGSEIVPLSKMVADDLVAQGDMNGARRILAGVAANPTSAGQLGQAAKILRDADPKTTIESVERIVDNLNDALGGKSKIVVDKALIDAYDRQTDNAGRADAGSDLRQCSQSNSVYAAGQVQRPALYQYAGQYQDPGAERRR